MLSRKERKRLEERIERLEAREDALYSVLDKIEPGTVLSDNLTAELREVHKQLLESERVLAENSTNWIKEAGDWLVKGVTALVPACITGYFVMKQTNRLAEIEDKMGILTSQSSKKMQTPRFK